MITTGIFDIGGVLHSNEMEHVYKDIRTYFELSEENFEKAYRSLITLHTTGKISEQEFWDRFCREIDSRKPLPEKSLFLREFEARFHPYTEVVELVKELKKNGYRLAALSDTMDSHASFLKDHGIYDLFSDHFFSHEVGMKKPASDIYLLTLEKLEIQPEEAFFVDDKLENVKTARKLGIHEIVFENSDKLKRDLLSLGVKI